jgi:DNA-binding transcriptional regulator YiaG
MVRGSQVRTGPLPRLDHEDGERIAVVVVVGHESDVTSQQVGHDSVLRGFDLVVNVFGAPKYAHGWFSFQTKKSAQGRGPRAPWGEWDFGLVGHRTWSSFAIGGTIAAMPNIASILKSEISRVARKEVRAETIALKKAVGTYRSEIAALKRRTQALEQQLRRLGKTSAKVTPVAETSGASRFSAKGLASQRRRLGLSAADCGLLLGVSSQSIYNWEEGKARPRAKHLPAIAALRSLGHKEAAAVLVARKG